MDRFFPYTSTVVPNCPIRIRDDKSRSATATLRITLCGYKSKLVSTFKLVGNFARIYLYFLIKYLI
jgi:hypothetical protein